MAQRVFVIRPGDHRAGNALQRARAVPAEKSKKDAGSGLSVSWVRTGEQIAVRKRHRLDAIIIARSCSSA
jgi:hypothetical protein